MTDDEAFIRAVVAAPADDAPRLVYADWLDDRGDPRGEYLRATVSWGQRLHDVETRDRAERQLRHFSRSIDPVWFCRVTAPPDGVCCDRVRMRDRGTSIVAGRIDQLESRLRINLPAAYRAFLLNYNGGSPEPDVFQIGYEHFSRVQAFFSLGEWLTGRAGEVSDDLLDAYAARVLGAPGLHGLFPIAAFVDSYRTDDDFEKEVERSAFAYLTDSETCLCIKLDTGAILRAHVELSRTTAHRGLGFPSETAVAKSLPALLDQLDELPDGWEPCYW